MLNTDNIEVIAINTNTVRVDGDLYYNWGPGIEHPFICFDMIKIEFRHIDEISWDNKYKYMKIPLHFIKKIDTNWGAFRRNIYAGPLFFLKKDLEFLKKMYPYYQGRSSHGPKLVLSAFSINSNGKMPKVVKTDNYYYYFDKELYEKFEFYGEQ